MRLVTARIAKESFLEELAFRFDGGTSVANKGQAVTIGTVIAAGLLFRPAGAPVFRPAEPPNPAAGATSSSYAVRTGPWIASCRYWAPYRPTDETQSKNVTRVRSELEAKATGTDIRFRVEGTNTEAELGCSGNELERWGFPRNTEGIDVTAIIAIVPDPIHSHLALDFDRSIDAILQAAADHAYVSSYYWMPWKNRLGMPKSAESQTDSELGHDPDRERQPGLIVLKDVKASSKVIYLFLVAETPTVGVDGFQLQSSFSYESQLESAVTKPGRFSRGRNGHVAIIGPEFSGSAASLAAGIKTAKTANPNLPDFEVSGTTSSTTPIDQMARVSKDGRHVDYLSFGDNWGYETTKLFGPDGLFVHTGMT